jgi:armadillo repeat-containing protein 2
MIVNPSGSNLTGAFKLIFKIAKNEQNDTLFIDTDLPELMVDALGKISPLSGKIEISS